MITYSRLFNEMNIEVSYEKRIFVFPVIKLYLPKYFYCILPFSN